MIKQYVLCCPYCGQDHRLIEEEQGKFLCEYCKNDFDSIEGNYTLKEIDFDIYHKIS